MTDPAKVILYGVDLSTYVSKVQVVLRNKSIEYVLCAPPDGYNSPAYRAISPLGSIPALVHDGRVLSESEAICEYLDERFSSPPMLPGSPAQRATLRMLSRVHDTWVEPQLRALFPFVKQGRSDGAVEHIQNFHMRLDRFAEVASPLPLLGGRELALADCAWPTSFAQAEQLFAHFGETLSLPPSLAEWRQHLDAHPAVAPVLKRCDQAMRSWMDGFANA